MFNKSKSFDFSTASHSFECFTDKRKVFKKILQHKNI